MRWMVLAVCVAAACAPDEVASTNASLLAYPANEPPAYAQSPTGAHYHNGAIMTGDTNLHLIFYGALTQAAKDLLTDFATNLSGSPTANVITTFADSNGDRPSGHFTVDTHSFTTASFGGALSDNVMSQIIHVIDGNNPDPNGIYVFVAGPNVDGLNKDGVSFCTAGAGGWHHTVLVGGTQLAKIAFIGNPAFCRAGAPCTKAGPNGTCNDTDRQAAVIWHEVAEAVSDPVPFGGYTPEVGDLCEGSFKQDDPTRPATGFVQLDLDYAAANGAPANVRLGTHDYALQPIWQNVDAGGCVRRLALQRPSVPLNGYPAGDLNYDSLGDLLLHNSDSGRVLARLVDGFGNFGAAQVLGTVGAHFQIYGVADFNGDAIGDILWRNLDSGRLSVWLLSASGAASHEIAATIPSEWAVKAVGDFDGNGYADILFLNLTDNTSRLWRNNGSLAPFTIGSINTVSPHPSASENLDSVGAGDIDGDGKSDVLWFHLATSSYRYWTFSGSGITSVPFDSSHFDYVLGLVNIKNFAVPVAVSGAQVVWVDSAGGAHPIAPMPAPEWRYSGASKYAGQPSLLWRNRQTGDVQRWLLATTNGALQSTQTVLTGEDLERQIIAY